MIGNYHLFYIVKLKVKRTSFSSEKLGLCQNIGDLSSNDNSLEAIISITVITYFRSVILLYDFVFVSCNFLALCPCQVIH